MKCEKCNEKEANFYYSSNINGEKTERHLCTDCARAEGFGGALDYRPMPTFDRMFEHFFEDFFAPRRSLLSGFDGFGSPLRRMMAPVFPRINIVIGAPEAETQIPSGEAEAKIPENAGEEVKAERELSALKYQLEEAVKAENFEQAIELRDRIRELEK